MSGFTLAPDTQCSWSWAAWVSNHSSLTGCGRIRYKHPPPSARFRGSQWLWVQRQKLGVRVSFLVIFAASAHLPFGKIDISPPHRSESWESKSHSVVSDSFRPQGLYSPWNFPGRILEWVALPFSRGSSQTQGSNPGLPNCRQILSQLSHTSLQICPGGLGASRSSAHLRSSAWPGCRP